MNRPYSCGYCAGAAGRRVCGRWFPCRICNGARTMDRSWAVRLVVEAAVRFRTWGARDGAAASVATEARSRGDLALARPYERALELGPLPLPMELAS